MTTLSNMTLQFTTALQYGNENLGIRTKFG